jgi:hypothetical protein
MIGPCYPAGDDTREGAIMVSFKGAHFVRDIILTCVRWYLAYPLSYRQVEELMEERGVAVDHATIHRWVLKYSSQLAGAFHHRKRPVGRSWRMDETYIRVKGSGAISIAPSISPGRPLTFCSRSTGQRSCAALSEESHPPPRGPRDDYHRRQ